MNFPSIMGIVNVTPDSFSDGGRYLDPEAALSHAFKLIEDGADILDIGGESTRPGSAPVALEEELKRILPVIHGIRKANSNVRISIDTTKSVVAEAAVLAGATMINDTSAARADANMLHVASRAGVPIVLMHMQGTPENMQNAPQYNDVVAEVESFLRERVSVAQTAYDDSLHHIKPAVYVDPGIGFGKTVEHNIALLKATYRFAQIAPVVVGVSRKRFIGSITGIESTEERDAATAMLHALLLSQPIDIVRVHNVSLLRQLKALSSAL